MRVELITWVLPFPDSFPFPRGSLVLPKKIYLPFSARKDLPLIARQLQRVRQLRAHGLLRFTIKYLLSRKFRREMDLEVSTHEVLMKLRLQGGPVTEESAALCAADLTPSHLLAEVPASTVALSLSSLSKYVA